MAAVSVVLPVVASAQTSCLSSRGGYCFEFSAAEICKGGICPGLEFFPAISDPNNPIGELLVNLYIFSVALAALSAFVMIVIAGALYLTARDNQTQITKAKTLIGNALWGLGLALLSYLILNTLNPDTLKGWTLNLPALPDPPPT